MSDYKLSHYLVLTDPVKKDASGDPQHILFATRTGEYSLIRQSVFEHMQQGRFAEIRPETLTSLIRMEAIVPAAENEFDEIIQRNRVGMHDETTLLITIQPTANCQLGCHYCGQQHSKKNVEAQVSQKITDRIIQKLASKKYKKLDVNWFGSEPLMAYGEILRMSERLRHYCSENQIQYVASMITNGLSFKKNVAIRLFEQNIRHFQITLDGGPETHDIMRITKEGKKTFAIILENIIEVANSQEYQDHGAKILVRMNVSKASVGGLYKLIDILAQHRLQEKNVVLDFATLSDWGGNGADADGLDKPEFALAEIDWFFYAIKKGFTFSNFVPTRIHAPCMAVRPDAEVYDAFGNVFPCYEFPYTPKYDTPEYKIGHVQDDPATNNQNVSTRNWFSDIKTPVSPCKSCNLFPVCGGGCPKQWYNGQVGCPSFKVNIKDRLVLQYLLNKKASAAQTSGPPSSTSAPIPETV